MKKMLIIRLSALGDVAMTIPVVYSLARQYPSLHIDVVTRPFFARLFINRPDNISIVTADLTGRHKGAAGMARLMRELSKLRPDCVADLHNVLRSWEIDAWMRIRGVRVAMVDKTAAAAASCSPTSSRSAISSTAMPTCSRVSAIR